MSIKRPVILLLLAMAALCGVDKPVESVDKSVSAKAATDTPPVIPPELQLKFAKVTAKSLRLDLDIQNTFGERIKEVRTESKQVQDQAQRACGEKYMPVAVGDDIQCSLKDTSVKKP